MSLKIYLKPNNTGEIKNKDLTIFIYHAMI